MDFKLRSKSSRELRKNRMVPIELADTWHTGQTGAISQQQPASNNQPLTNHQQLGDFSYPAAQLSRPFLRVWRILVLAWQPVHQRTQLGEHWILEASSRL